MVLWLLLTYGITLVITGSKLFLWLRKADPTGLFQCPMCTGWWVGFWLTFVLYHPASPSLADQAGGTGGPAFGALSTFDHLPVGLLEALANGFCASAWCWIVHVVLTRLSLGVEKLL